MKKLIVAITTLLFAASSALADIKIGLSGMGTAFDGAKGTEEHKGVVSTRTEDLAIAYGSIFIEASVLDMFSLGIDYVPYDIEGETVSNTRRQNPNVNSPLMHTETFNVDIEEHTTVYALVPLGDEGVYVKAGASMATVSIGGSRNSGSKYPDEELLGGHISLGYERDVAALFVRGELGYSEYATVEANSDQGKTRFKAALEDGIHARISVGKSF